jgi:hypothetical protein
MTEPKLTLDSLRGKLTCKTRQIIDSFSPEDQATLNEALAGPEDEFPSGRLVTVLAELGISITKDTIIRHRRGHCSCKPPLGDN